MSQVQYVHAGCPRCGSQMTYEGGKKALKCNRCNYKRELGRNTDQVQPHSMTSGIKWGSFTKGMGMELNAFKCGKCSAILSQPGEEPPESCLFCGGTEFEKNDRINKVMEPYGMVPFAISKKSAIKKLNKWLSPRAVFPLPSNKYWYPKGIRKILLPENVHGVYIPVFFADVFTRSTWTGKAGFQTMKEQKGKVVKSKVFEPVAGYYENFFQDQQQFDTKGVDKHFPDILPFQFRDIIPFNAQHLSNWPAEISQSKEVDLLKKMEGRLNKRIESTAKRRSKGEGMKDMKIKSEKFLIAFRHVLMPVWIATYYYSGQKYQFLVNAQTGKVAGMKPISFRRIAIAIITAVVLMLLTAWLTSL